MDLRELILRIPSNLRPAVASLAGVTESMLQDALDNSDGNVVIYGDDELRVEMDINLLEAIRQIGLALGHRGLVTLSAITESVLAPKEAHREAAVTLRQVNHVLTQDDGPVPTEPWPEGADSGIVLERAGVAVQALQATVTALGKLSKPPKRIVRRVGLCAGTWSGESVLSVERSLRNAGVAEIMIEISDNPWQARRAVSDRVRDAGGGPVLFVSGQGSVSESDNMFLDVFAWLCTVEVR